MSAISHFIVFYQVTSEVTKRKKETTVGGLRMCEGADPHNYPHSLFSTFSITKNCVKYSLMQVHSIASGAKEEKDSNKSRENLLFLFIKNLSEKN